MPEKPTTKTMNARNIFILTAGLLLLASKAEAKRTCRIVYPERPQGAPKTAFLFDGTKSQDVTLPSMNLSEVIEVPSGELTLAMTAEKISDPKKLAPDTPFLVIPELVRDFYIIITLDSKNQIFPVKMNLVETGGDKLKPGETLWSNLTEHRIVAKLGDAAMTLEPRGKTISKDPAPSSGYYVAKFSYQAAGKGPLAPITEQSWWHDAGSRHLGFVVNTGGRLPKIYFFRDFREPEAEKQKK